MTIPLDPTEGRRLYGNSPEAYREGRPDYPEPVYGILRNCGLARDARVLEIGPGTGLVTRHLLDAGASVTAVEANPDMAGYLRSNLKRDLDLIARPFEEADLGDGAFDLAVAATSFHWVNQAQGWPKLKACLRYGAWAVIWWMLFQDPESPDAFDWAIHDVLGGDPALRVEPRSTPFQLAREAREGDFHAAGFAEVSSEFIRAPYLLTADQVRALYATTAVVLRRPHDEQTEVLDRLQRVVLERFDGQVERTFVTALYRGRNG